MLARKEGKMPSGPPVFLDDVDVEELDTLARNCEKLPDLLSKSAEIGPRVGLVTMARLLAKRIGADTGELNGVISAFVNLYERHSDLDGSSEAAVEEVTRGLEFREETKVLEAWNAAKAKIAHALDNLSPEHPLVVSYEAGQIAFSRSHVVVSMRMLTGTLPVFNKSRDRVLFAVINHALVMEYHDGPRRHAEIHLSLDATDIALLRALCDEAEAAADTLKASGPAPAGSPFDLDDVE